MTPSPDPHDARLDAAPRRLDLERYVPGLLTFLANKLARDASAAYEEAFGVNVTDWRILSQLAIEPGIAAARICQVIGLDKAPVSRRLAALEARGLVCSFSDQVDGRKRSLRLSETGSRLQEQILAAALRREERVLACLDAAEREQLLELLNRLHANLPGRPARAPRADPAAPDGQAGP